MSAVYAKLRRLPPLFLMMALLFTLSACQGGRYSSWDIPVNTGVVTKNPDDVPNIAWQTSRQRDILNRQSESYARAQTMSEHPTMSTPEPQSGDAPVTADTAAPQQKQEAYKTGGAGKAKVALLLPLTGKYANIGQSMLKAAQMALFDVGSANIELIPRDTASTATGAAAAAEQARRENAHLVLGPVFAEDVKQVKNVFNQTATPVVAFTTDWTLADNNTYIMGFMPFAQVARVAEYAQRNGYDDVAVFAPQTEYSDVVISTLRRVNTRLTKINRYSPMQSDLSTIVQDFVDTSRTRFDESGKIAHVNFDALVLPVGGQALRTLTSLLDGAGLRAENMRLIGTGLWDDPALFDDPTLYGGWYAAPDPRLRSDFEKNYKNNFGEEPPRLASLAYDATALAAVLAHTATAGEASFTHARLTNPRGFAGIDGIFRFRQNGLSERGLAVLEINNGKSRVIDPAPTAFISSGS